MLARLLSFALDHTEMTADQARAMADAHGDDWRAWLLVAGAGSKPGEAEAARARACELAAANPALLPPASLCRAHPAQASSP